MDLPSELQFLAKIHENGDFERGRPQNIEKRCFEDAVQRLVSGNNNDDAFIDQQIGVPLPHDRFVVAQGDGMTARDPRILGEFVAQGILIELTRKTCAEFAVHPVDGSYDLARYVEVKELGLIHLAETR